MYITSERWLDTQSSTPRLLPILSFPHDPSCPLVMDGWWVIITLSTASVFLRIWEGKKLLANLVKWLVSCTLLGRRIQSRLLCFRFLMTIDIQNSMPKILKDTFFQEFKARYQISKSKLVCNSFISFYDSPHPFLEYFCMFFCISMAVRNLKPGSLDWILRPSRVEREDSTQPRFAQALIAPVLGI